MVLSLCGFCNPIFRKAIGDLSRDNGCTEKVATLSRTCIIIMIKGADPEKRDPLVVGRR